MSSVNRNAAQNILRGSYLGAKSTLKYGVAKLTSMNRNNSQAVRQQARQDMKAADEQFGEAGGHLRTARKQIGKALSNEGKPAGRPVHLDGFGD